MPSGFSECSAIDLYAARCSILHSYTSKSTLSRRGEARAIQYAWGNHAAAPLQELIDSAGLGDQFVVVHIDGLIEHFKVAVDQFFREAASDAPLCELVSHRSREDLDEQRDVL
jgi:hypothetical protein